MGPVILYIYGVLYCKLYECLAVCNVIICVCLSICPHVPNPNAYTPLPPSTVWPCTEAYLPACLGRCGRLW